MSFDGATLRPLSLGNSVRKGDRPVINPDYSRLCVGVKPAGCRRPESTTRCAAHCPLLVPIGHRETPSIQVALAAESRKLRRWFPFQSVSRARRSPASTFSATGTTSGLSTSENTPDGLSAATIEPPPSRSITTTLQGRRTPRRGSPVEKRPPVRTGGLRVLLQKANLKPSWYEASLVRLSTSER